MKGIKSVEKGSQWPIREVHPLNRGNLFLIVKRDISFFCAHGTYARRRTAKHYEFDGETINEGENGHPFFLVYKHRVIRISAQKLEKTPSLVGTRPVRARGTNSGPFLTRRIKSVGDPKQQGMLFFGTHVRLRGWNQ